MLSYHQTVKDWHPAFSKFNGPKTAEVQASEAIREGDLFREMIKGKRILPCVEKEAA